MKIVIKILIVMIVMERETEVDGVIKVMNDRVVMVIVGVGMIVNGRGNDVKKNRKG